MLTYRLLAVSVDVDADLLLGEQGLGLKVVAELAGVDISADDVVEQDRLDDGDVLHQLGVLFLERSESLEQNKRKRW